jgi:hypothetical protein
MAIKERTGATGPYDTLAMNMEVKCASECLYPSAKYIAAHPRSSKYQFHKILTSLSPNTSICLCSLSSPVTNDAPCRLTCARYIHVRRSVLGTNIEGPRSQLHDGPLQLLSETEAQHSTRPAVPPTCPDVAHGDNCACSTRFIMPTAVIY